MKKNNRTRYETHLSWIIILVPIVILTIAFLNKTNRTSQPKANQGHLNTNDWDFSSEGNIKLDGEWEFYWDQILTPEMFKDSIPPKMTGYMKIPGIWNGYQADGKKLTGDGCASFRLKTKIKDPSKLYALKIITMSNSYKLWADGKLIAENGKVGFDKKNNQPEYRSQVVSFQPSSENIEFVVQVSNFYHYKGGIWHPIKMGEYRTVQYERDSRVILEMFLFGCLFMMGVYHLAAFSLRKKEISLLHFGIMCFVVGFRSLFTGENNIGIIIPNLDWFIARKIEFILTFAAVPAYASFSRSLYKKEWSKIVYWGTIGLGGALCLFVLFTPTKIFTFGSYIFTPYSLLASIYMIYVFIVATIRKREGAGLFLATSIFFLITIINEVLNQTEVVHTGLYLPVGLLIVVFAQSYILSSRSANAFRTTEIYAATFQKFVPKQFLNRIAKEGLEFIKPGNAEKGEITVLFSDIRSFTSISEKMSPDEVFNMLNEYLSRVEPPIRKNHGFVDKYMGDGIMALFEKAENESSAYNTLLAALEMQESLKKYNEERISAHLFPLEMGIGIHTGQVIIGTLGGNERMDSTAIGDAVNLCSRIEGMTKMYGAKILVSGHSISLLHNKSEFLFRFVDFVVAKGKTEPVGIWEVLGKINDEGLQKEKEWMDIYNDGINLYREKKYPEAKLKFQECLVHHPDDKVSAIYVERCDAILGNNSNGDFLITHLSTK